MGFSSSPALFRELIFMRRFMRLFVLTVFSVILASASPAAGYHPLGGVWEYEGSANVKFGEQTATFKEKGKITADAGYSYDWWRDDYDEWIYSFRAEGTFSLSVSPEIKKGYNHYSRVDRRFRYSVFEVSFKDSRYSVKITGRRTADVTITRIVEGKEVKAVFPAYRIRWDRDWERYYDGGPFYGISAGCTAGRSSPSLLLLLAPLLLLAKPR